jgi:tRNA pseudouridine55 synthase
VNDTKRENEAIGYLLIDKPAGPSSHDVVGWVRWTLGIKAVGHCGTLDPAATGLLVITIGAATRCAQWISDGDKTYEAEFLLGRSTTTGDMQGETVDELDAVSAEYLQRAEAVLSEMKGTHALPPPRFSAVSIDGKRAYALARSGESVELPERRMHVETLAFRGSCRDGNLARLRVRLCVSKGTYIRSLAVELGARLGVPVCLYSLHRVGSGAFSLEDLERWPILSGISAVRLADRPGEARGTVKPKWRLRFADDISLEEARARISNALIPPQLGLEIPTVQIEAEKSALMARFELGQQIRGDERDWDWLSRHVPEDRPAVFFACESSTDSAPIRAYPPNLTHSPGDPVHEGRSAATIFSNAGDAVKSAKMREFPKLTSFVVVGRMAGRGGEPVIGPLAVILRDAARK